jgi:hypothetical protein
VRYPGDLLRVFARDADGHIQTQKQPTPGTAFPGTWQTVGTADQTFPGSPAAILAPDTGLVEVLALGADGHNYYSQELSQGAGTWPTWKPVVTDVDEQYTATTPTPFVYTTGGVQKWAFLSYTADFKLRVFSASSASGSAKAAKSTKAADPVFSRKAIPAAPKK